MTSILHAEEIEMETYRDATLMSIVRLGMPSYPRRIAPTRDGAYA
jgi:hypothetical protein